MAKQKHGQITPEKEAYFRTKLNEKAERIRDAIETEDIDAYQESVDGLGELTNYPLHTADQGTEEDRRDMDYRLRERMRNELYEVQDALRRLDEGVYGICERTGHEIPLRRLEALPEASYELARQEEEELQQRASERYEEPFRRKSHIQKKAIDSGDQTNTENWSSPD